MNEERLVDIEMKIDFQENTIKELNDVVCRQQEEIGELRKTCNLLFNQLKSLSITPSGNNPKDEKPPHY